jgi:hypothetical protein
MNARTGSVRGLADWQIEGGAWPSGITALFTRRVAGQPATAYCGEKRSSKMGRPAPTARRRRLSKLRCTPLTARLDIPFGLALAKLATVAILTGRSMTARDTHAGSRLPEDENGCVSLGCFFDFIQHWAHRAVAPEFYFFEASLQIFKLGVGRRAGRLCHFLEVTR